MVSLKLKQTLWFVNKHTKALDSAIVCHIDDSWFAIKHNGEYYHVNNHLLGERIFVDKPLEPACNNCWLRVSERCSQIGGSVCSDYIAYVPASADDLENRPVSSAVKRFDQNGFGKRNRQR